MDWTAGRRAVGFEVGRGPQVVARRAACRPLAKPQKLAFCCACASSAKSVLIVFDDHSDVSEKTVQVAVTSLPKEIVVPVKINVTEVRSRQVKFIFSKNNYHVGFHCCVSTRSYA